VRGSLWLVGVVGLWLQGCGGNDAPASRVMSSGGGGMGGMAGSLSLGSSGSGGIAGGGAGGSTAGGAGGATAGGAGGGNVDLPKAPDIELHACPAEPEPPCPALVLPGDVTISNDEDLAGLQGVTAVEGGLNLSGIGVSPTSLSCLETVGDDLEIRLFAADMDVSLWGLRNLRSVAGSIELSAGLDRLYIDCAFRHLESVGERYATGGAIDTSGDVSGELDVSNLKRARHIRLRGGQLTRVVLPSDRTLNMGQLQIEDHDYLTEVAGFAGVTIQSASLVSGAYSVRIVDNPQLSTCRANELAQLFIAGGSPQETVTIEGNAPCAM
jgi:hypothetical protein